MTSTWETRDTTQTVANLHQAYAMRKEVCSSPRTRRAGITGRSEEAEFWIFRLNQGPARTTKFEAYSSQFTAYIRTYTSSYATIVQLLKLTNRTRPCISGSTTRTADVPLIKHTKYIPEVLRTSKNMILLYGTSVFIKLEMGKLAAVICVVGYKASTAQQQ